MARRDRHPPGRDLLRAKLRKAAAAEDTDRLGEKPAELVDRLRFRVMLGEVLLDELLQRQRAADALLPPAMLERPFECLRRVTLGGEASSLKTSRTWTAGPIPVRPYRAAVDRALLELEDLTLVQPAVLYPSSSRRASGSRCRSAEPWSALLPDRGAPHLARSHGFRPRRS